MAGSAQRKKQNSLKIKEKTGTVTAKYIMQGTKEKDQQTVRPQNK